MKTLLNSIVITMIIMFVQFDNNLVHSQCVNCGPGTFISTSTGNGTVSIGNFINNSITRSIIIGEGYSDQAYLSNSTFPHCLMIGFLSTKPTVFVSTSTYSPLHDKTGKVGIGNVTNPQAKLHIRADVGEEAAIFIEPNAWGIGSLAKIKLGNVQFGIVASRDTGLYFKTPSYYCFAEGRVGIGRSRL